MYIAKTINEPQLKACPFCNSIALYVSVLSYENGDDEGYRPICNCRWAYKIVGKWFSNKNQLIEYYNNFVQEGQVN